MDHYEQNLRRNGIKVRQLEIKCLLFLVLDINLVYFYIFISNIPLKMELAKNVSKVYIHFYLFIDNGLF